MNIEFLTKRKTAKKLRLFKKHLRHRIHYDDDILSEKIKSRLDELLIEAESLDNAGVEAVEGFLGDAPERIERVLPPLKYRTLREWTDILAVAVVVAFGIRALFLQPFKIPTSSMQPTLFGIHYIKKEARPKLPSVIELPVFGTRKAELKVKEKGFLKEDFIKPETDFFLFNSTELMIGNKKYRLPGKPEKVEQYALRNRRFFEKGQILCDGWLSTGDHLFVDRFSHHFTGLKRGDVIVFNTVGLTYGFRKLVDRGYYYIKRLVGLPGDVIRIRDDVVYIKKAGATEEQKLTELSDAFKKIYSLKGGYHGHLNAEGAIYLTDNSETFTVPENSYFVMGDNSNSSLDSRYFGAVPRDNIVGKGFFVFWPFSRRWGLVDSKPPLDTPTKETFPSMNMQ